MRIEKENINWQEKKPGLATNFLHGPEKGMIPINLGWLPQSLLFFFQYKLQALGWLLEIEGRLHQVI